MAVAFRAAASQANTGASTTITITKPAGTINGDVMVAYISVLTAAARTFTPPSGWTQLDTAIADNILGTATQGFTFYKVAGTGEGASYQWTCSASHIMAGVISTYSGVDSAAPINANAITNVNDVQGTAATPVVTTTRPNCGVVNMASGSLVLSQGPTFTWPASTTKDAEARGNIGLSNNTTAAIGHDNSNQAASGNTTARTITSSSNTTWVLSTIALTPAGNPPPVRMLRQAVKRSASW